MTQLKSTMKAEGFTLVELMVVIVIAAILLTIAVPSFDNLIRRNNVESLQTTLSSAVATARTEAASRNRVVTICASSNATDCGNDWNKGWIVFEDRESPIGARDAAKEPLIDVYQHSGDYTFTTSTGSTAPTELSFTSQGFLREGQQPTLFTICEPKSNTSFARGIFVNASGLVMKTRDGNGDGVHDNPVSSEQGAPLVCNN